MNSPNRMSRAHLVLFLLIGAWLGLLAATKVSDPDTMQYLASGRYTMEHGLEQDCVFNYSSDQCQIVYPQWLFHVLTYVAYRAGGFGALVALQVAIVIGVFGVVFAGQRRAGRHLLGTAAVFVLVALVARERFMLRADLFALLPAVLAYECLDRIRARESSSVVNVPLLLALAGIQIVWANTHGSFPVAFVLAGAFLVDSVFALRRVRVSRKAATVSGQDAVRRMAIAAGVVVAASFLNPYGLDAFLQPFRFLLQGQAMAPQMEFLSPFAPADIVRLPVLAYKLLLGFVAVMLVLGFRALRVRDVLILGPLVYLSATGVRHIALFAVFCAVLLPRYVVHLCLRVTTSGFGRRLTNRAQALAVAAVAIVVVVILGSGYAAATDALYRFDSVSRRTGFGLSDLVYPSAAADFVERYDPPGNVFNDYSVGTFLNWRLFPKRKTFIDGHSYTAERLTHYRQIMSGAVPYQQIAAKYGVRFFFLSHKSAESRGLIAKLVRDRHWPLVYFDEMTMIFVEDVPENRALIERERVDLGARSGTVPTELANVRNPRDAYLGYTDRGLILSSLALDADAVLELEEALRRNHRSFVTLTALGMLLDKRGESARGIEACEKSVAIRRGYAPGHFWLGVVSLRQKRFETGIAELGKALRINGRMPMAHFYIATALEHQGDTAAALEHYRKETEINPAFKPAQDALRRLRQR